MVAEHWSLQMMQHRPFEAMAANNLALSVLLRDVGCSAARGWLVEASSFLRQCAFHLNGVTFSLSEALDFELVSSLSFARAYGGAPSATATSAQLFGCVGKPLRAQVSPTASHALQGDQGERIDDVRQSSKTLPLGGRQFQQECCQCRDRHLCAVSGCSLSLLEKYLRKCSRRHLPCERSGGFL